MKELNSIQNEFPHLKSYYEMEVMEKRDVPH